jgi:hypothetical protein
LNLQHTYQKLRWEDNTVFTANLSEARIVYYLSRQAFIRAILQYNLTTRDPDLYENPIDARSENLFTQFLFSYEVTPQTVVYVGYSDAHQGSEEFELEQRERSLFIKLGYAIRP